MKPLYFIMPLTALVVGFFLLSNQHDKTNDLFAENKQLRQKIQTAQSRTNKRTKKHTSLLAAKQVDWQRVAHLLSQNYTAGHYYLKPNLRLERELRALNFDELVAAMEDVKLRDLDDAQKRHLFSKLRSLMSNAYPEQTLKTFIQHHQEIDWKYVLGNSFYKWISKNPSIAAQWYVQHHEQVGFKDKEGNTILPVNIIRAGIFSAMSIDSTVTEQLVKTVPMDKRRNTLGGTHLSRLTTKDYSTWALLVRKHLPSKDRAKMITWPLSNWSDGDGASLGLDDTSDYLQKINANDKEKQLCIMKIAEQPGSWVSKKWDRRKDYAVALRSLSDWTKKQAPELVDEATLKALQHISKWHRVKFAESAKLHLQYYHESRNDAYLTQALELKDANKHPDLVQQLINQVTDPATRQYYLKKHQLSTQP